MWLGDVCSGVVAIVNTTGIGKNKCKCHVTLVVMTVRPQQFSGSLLVCMISSERY